MSPKPPTNNLLEINVNLQAFRKDYHNDVEPFLYEHNMCVDPFVQFDIWFKNVTGRTDISYEEVNAVALSTCRDNKPSSRMVLLKEYSNNGFTFYTNSISRKAQEIRENPNAALLFYWPFVNRQVRIEGVVEVLDEKLAEDYWQKRPLGSRIGSKLSAQSSIIPNREHLDEQKKQLEKLVAEKGPEAITKPKTWLGFILKPAYFEFWQGQTNRLHDRLIYEKQASNGDTGKWVLKRLAP